MSSLRKDYKEGFSKSEVFTILVRLLLDALDQEACTQKRVYVISQLSLCDIMCIYNILYIFVCIKNKMQETNNHQAESRRNGYISEFIALYNR